MVLMKEYLNKINVRLNHIYDDLIILRSSAIVHFNTKDNDDSIHVLLNGIANEQAIGSINRVVLNLCAILDDDTRGLNIFKIINKLQADPKKYDLSNDRANYLHKRFTTILTAIKENKIYLDLKNLRDESVAHIDLSSLKKSYSFPDGFHSFFRTVVELTNIIFSIFNLPENDFNYTKKSNLEQLFEKCTPPSSKKFI
jgi:hypothetical protein